VDAFTQARGGVSVVPTTDGERVALTAFLSYAVLAGGNAVCIRFSNRELCAQQRGVPARITTY